MKNGYLFLCASIAAAIAADPLTIKAQSAASSQNMAVADLDTAEASRVTQTISNASLATLAGTHSAKLAAAPTTGSVADSAPMNLW